MEALISSWFPSEERSYTVIPTDTVRSLHWSAPSHLCQESRARRRPQELKAGIEFAERQCRWSRTDRVVQQRAELQANGAMVSSRQAAWCALLPI